MERLEFEINTILKMGFPGYFLIVGDFINWAKNNGCPVGPGRGSGAGSLVAYALKITDLDPLQYNLLFERFLNPERVSMPDFDIDFCQGNRDRVIDYVKDKYGRDAVSQIATFGTMAARAAIRDVGRVLDMSYTFCDGISKLIPNKPGKPSRSSRRRQARRRQEPTTRSRWSRARGTHREGRVKYAAGRAGAEARRHDAQHRHARRRRADRAGQAHRLLPALPAAGQRLGGEPVRQGRRRGHRPGEVRLSGPGDAHHPGDRARSSSSSATRARRTSPSRTSRSTTRTTYKLFSDGKTEAVFQFESRGMQGMLRDARPTRLEDLIALNALYRPGPMDLIPSFVARKHGREPVEYPHPLVAEMLSETYGIMVYQEQVMQTAQILGGYSLGGADLLRRAMGKKKAEEMAEHRADLPRRRGQERHRRRRRPTRSST